MYFPNEGLSIQSQITDKVAITGFLKDLLSCGIIPVVPLVDMGGADLLAFKEIKDEVKYARIQVKGRTLRKTKDKTKVEIRKEYVIGSFFCLLKIILLSQGKPMEYNYCFFKNDIEEDKGPWKLKADNYILNFTAQNFKNKLDLYEFNRPRRQSLLNFLEESNPAKEIHDVVGKLDLVLPAFKAHFE